MIPLDSHLMDKARERRAKQHAPSPSKDLHRLEPPMTHVVLPSSPLIHNIHSNRTLSSPLNGSKPRPPMRQRLLPLLVLTFLCKHSYESFNTLK